MAVPLGELPGPTVVAGIKTSALPGPGLLASGTPAGDKISLLIKIKTKNWTSFVFMIKKRSYKENMPA